MQCKIVDDIHIILLHNIFQLTIKNTSLFPLDNISKHEAHEKKHTIISGSHLRKNMESYL